MSGKIQNEDIKSIAELVAAGGAASQLPNDDKVWIASLSETLAQAIANGDIGGSKPPTYEATAGENLPANTPIYICNTSSDPGRTVGRAYKLDPTNQYRYIYAGITQAAVLITETVTIQVGAELDGFSGLPIGKQIWASLTMPGDFQTTQPDITSVLSVPLGQASTTATKLLINGALFNTAEGVIPALLVAGYFAGGSRVVGTETPVNTIGKILFSSDAYSALSATLTFAKDHIQGASSRLKGYFMGGHNGSVYVNSIDALLFSNESNAAISANLPNATGNGAGTQSSTKGYVSGDQFGSTTIQALTFLGETTSTASATLSSGVSNVGGLSSLTAGYITGGVIPPTTVTTIINKMTFSSETTANLGTGLPSARDLTQGLASRQNGYVCGGLSGISGPITNTIFRIAFTNDAISTLGTMTTNKDTGGTVSGNVAGYIAGGETVISSVITTQIEKLDFVSETSAANSSSLGQALYFIQHGVQH